MVGGGGEFENAGFAFKCERKTYGKRSFLTTMTPQQSCDLTVRVFPKLKYRMTADCGTPSTRIKLLTIFFTRLNNKTMPVPKAMFNTNDRNDMSNVTCV